MAQFLVDKRTFPRHTQPDNSGWIRFAVSRAILFKRAAEGVLGERTAERDSRHPDQKFFARQTVFSDAPWIRFAVSRSILFTAAARTLSDEFIVPPLKNRWKFDGNWIQETAWIFQNLPVPGGFDPATLPGLWQLLASGRPTNLSKSPFDNFFFTGLGSGAFFHHHRRMAPIIQRRKRTR